MNKRKFLLYTKIKVYAVRILLEAMKNRFYNFYITLECGPLTIALYIIFRDYFNNVALSSPNPL